MMKKSMLFIVTLLTLCTGVNAKTLVAFYSYTNNVRTIVTELRSQLDVDVVEIQPSEEGLDYAANGYALGKELINAIKAAPNDAASYPSIKAVDVDFNDYSEIIIATPLWWSHMAAPMQSFLFAHGSAMAGKRIRLIVSSASSGISGVISDTKRLIPGGNYSSKTLWIKSSEVSSAASMINTWLLSTHQVSPLDPQKIAVLSDPHVMAPELLVSEGSAWTEYLEKQRKLVDYSKELFDEFIVRLKRDIRPGMLLITGDLTKDGEKVSHEYVISKLKELSAIGIRTLVIPGNHDRGENSNAVYFDGATTTPAEGVTNATFATMYADYGYGSHSARESTSLTYALEPIDGLVVIGIDSGTDGRVSDVTLNWVYKRAKDAYKKGKQVIAMMHHPLIPHFTGVNTFVSTAVVNNYTKVRNALADAGVRVVFTGHFHTSDIAKDYNADLSKTIYDVNTGSLISYPCDYRVVTLSSDLNTLDITTSSIQEIVAGDGFGTMAKNRLHEAAKEAVKAKGTAYAYVADDAADAYIYHAEGDEAENSDAQKTRSGLISMGSLARMFGVISESQYTALTSMANSMLLDLSNYGDEEREDKTADRMLSITMPILTESVSPSSNGWATYCSSRTLDLSKTEGVTGYIVTSASENKVEVAPVTVVPAGTGFLLNGTGASLYELYATDSSAADVSDNKLIGTQEDTTAPENAFVLSSNGSTTGFFPAQTGATIPAHTAYLLLSGSGVRVLDLNGGVTAVTRLTTDHADGVGYTLQGIRASQPSKGVIIKDSKLFIAK